MDVMWLVSSARTADRPLWSLRVWRSYELIERTDFLRSFTAFLPNSRFALSRLCPEASRYDSRRSLYVCDPDNVEGSHRIAAKRPAEAVRIPSDSGSVDYLGTHYRPSSTSSPTRSFLLHSTPSAPYPSIGSWLVRTYDFTSTHIQHGERVHKNARRGAPAFPGQRRAGSVRPAGGEPAGKARQEWYVDHGVTRV